MKCPNCAMEANPTLVYCASCGMPLEIDLDTLREDEEQKALARREIAGLQLAKARFVLALFLFGCLVAARWVLLEDQHHDAIPAYRVPAELVERAGVDPPVAVEVQRLDIPLPTK